MPPDYYLTSRSLTICDIVCITAAGFRFAAARELSGIGYFCLPTILTFQLGNIGFLLQTHPFAPARSATLDHDAALQQNST